ncbi:MAG: class I SAM-dependent methyltransferase [Christensenella sp.]|nr:class I SAM-dependent methyltransferase [Christensenella sp.]
MEKASVIEFFDQLAPTWDAHEVRNESRLKSILDYADIRAGVSVLDVACGTGVLIPNYLERDVARITGVDVSPVMIACAKAKFTSPRVTLLTADMEETSFSVPFDRCVVYNAFPHFPSPERLIRHLSRQLVPGGRLTIAHGMSRAAINRHHSGSASKVSVGLIPETELAEILNEWFTVDVVVSNDEIYVVSGVRAESSAIE